MQEYDAALKLQLRKAARTMIQMLTGVPISQWLDIELPKTQNLRMDLLGWDMNGNLHHFELRSTNDSDIDLRMAKYALGAYRLKGKFPRQTVLYVGAAPLSMPSEWRGEGVSIQYRVIDIREFDGELLLASDDIGDNLIAVLTRLRDHKEAIRKIVKRIAGLPESARDAAVQQFVILAGLRRLRETVREEVAKMPIIIDLMENDIIGPAIRQGLEQGLEQGLKKGREEGEHRLLRRLIEKRFGQLPEWANTKLAKLSVAEIEALGERLFEAQTMERLLN